MIRRHSIYFAAAVLSVGSLAFLGCDERKGHDRDADGTHNTANTTVPGTTNTGPVSDSAGGVDGTMRSGAGHGTEGDGARGAGFGATEQTTNARNGATGTAGPPPSTQPIEPRTKESGNVNGGEGRTGTAPGGYNAATSGNGTNAGTTGGTSGSRTSDTGTNGRK